MWFDLPSPTSKLSEIDSDLAALHVGPSSPIGNPFLLRDDNPKTAFMNYKNWLATQGDLLRYMRQRLTGRPMTGLDLSPNDMDLVWLYAEIAAGSWDHLIAPEPKIVYESYIESRYLTHSVTAEQFYRCDPRVFHGETGHGFALGTRDDHGHSLPITELLCALGEFYSYARSHPDSTFQLTQVVSSRSDKDTESIEQFCSEYAPSNVLLPGAWLYRSGKCRPRLFITGSKELTRYSVMEDKLDALTCRLDNPIVITNGSRGAQRLAERYAVERELTLVRRPTYWHALDTLAQELVDSLVCTYATHVIAFWDGAKGRTEKLIERAHYSGLPLRLVRV